MIEVKAPDEFISELWTYAEEVPTIMPSPVNLDRSRTTANPKSPILAVPFSVSHTLPGFRSR